jgi:hypothetical protein
MGKEIECRIRYQEQALTGKAYLETDHFLFRGTQRLKVLFKDLTKVEAEGGILRLEFTGGPAELELGSAAEKWAEKILHPPSRLHKLGVKPGMAVRLVGQFDEDFLADLESSRIEKVLDQADLIFLAADSKAKLARIRKLKIREIDVIHAGRANDLKDVKVASFSLTHTALKFVIPVIHRRPPL